MINKKANADIRIQLEVPSWLETKDIFKSLHNKHNESCTKKLLAEN